MENFRPSGIQSIKRDHQKSVFPALHFAFFCVGFTLSKALFSDPKSSKHTSFILKPADQNDFFSVILVKGSGFSPRCLDLGFVPTPEVDTTLEPGRLRGQRSNQVKEK